MLKNNNHVNRNTIPLKQEREENYQVKCATLSNYVSKGVFDGAVRRVADGFTNDWNMFLGAIGLLIRFSII